jgi:phosphoserine phosphatase
LNAKYRFVFFDVDSTVVTIEGIDVLAGGNPEIARLTDAAMNGEIPLEDVYARRLDMIRPSRADVDRLAQQYLDAVVPGAAEAMERLREAGAVVQFVSAGIRQAIEPLAARLGASSLHAVTLRFHGDGAYGGFEPSFLTRTGGKELVIRDVRARSKGKAAMIGDGASDLEARPAVDLFIGFGGVTLRPRVKENADVYIEERDLRLVLPHLVD